MAGLLHLNDDCLHLLCNAASLVHPPHWQFTASNDHDWKPLPMHDHRYEPSERRFCIGWVLLSHVCRRLRRICLDSPALWAGAILALPSMNAWNTFLERARDSALELCIPTNHCSLKESKDLEGQYMEKIWFAQEYVHRARRLETIVDDERPADWHRVFNGQSYPRLQTLTIHQYSSILSESRLKVHASNLRSVALKNTVPIFLSPLRMLRQLSIHLEEGFMLNDDAPILNILRETALLSQLDLKLQIVPNSPIKEALVSQTPIILSHLQLADIQLRGAVDTGLVIPLILAPETATIRVALLSGCTKQTDLLAALSRQLHCKCCNLVNICLDSLFAFSTSSTKVQAHANGHVTFAQLSGGINTTLALMPGYTNNPRIDVLVIGLQAPYDVAGSAATLSSFFHAYSRITILKLDTDAQTNRALYHLLAENARAAGPDSDALLFPALDTLSIARTSKLYMTSPDLVRAHWDAVVEMLEARAIIRRRIRLLSLWGEWGWRRYLDSDILRVIEERAMYLAAIYVEEVDDCRDELDWKI